MALSIKHGRRESCVYSVAQWRTNSWHCLASNEDPIFHRCTSGFVWSAFGCYNNIYDNLWVVVFLHSRPTMDDFVLSTQKTFLSKCLLVHMFTVGCSQDNALFLLFQWLTQSKCTVKISSMAAIRLPNLSPVCYTDSTGSVPRTGEFVTSGFWNWPNIYGSQCKVLPSSLRSNSSFVWPPMKNLHGIVFKYRPLHGFHRRLGCGAVAAKIRANVWEILQLSTLITPQLHLQFWQKMCLYKGNDMEIISSKHEEEFKATTFVVNILKLHTGPYKS